MPLFPHLTSNDIRFPVHTNFRAHTLLLGKVTTCTALSPHATAAPSQSRPSEIVWRWSKVEKPRGPGRSRENRREARVLFQTESLRGVELPVGGLRVCQFCSVRSRAARRPGRLGRGANVCIGVPKKEGVLAPPCPVSSPFSPPVVAHSFPFPFALSESSPFPESFLCPSGYRACTIV